MYLLSKLILTISVFFMASCATNKAEIVYVNGSIWTGVENAFRAQAMAVKGEYLVAVGSNEIVENFKNSMKLVTLNEEVRSFIQSNPVFHGWGISACPP